VKVVDLLEADLAGRHAHARRQAPQDVIEIVDVHSLGRPAGERHPFGHRPAAEVAEQQQTHRVALVARTAAAAEPEVELQPSCHRCPPSRPEV
jgi:hypothetical protein